MGFSATDIDPLLHSPRNVWNDKGQLIGTYFPATQVIRLNEGSLLQIESSGKIRHPDGELEFLDKSTFVLKARVTEKRRLDDHS